MKLSEHPPKLCASLDARAHKRGVPAGEQACKVLQGATVQSRPTGRRVGRGQLSTPPFRWSWVAFRIRFEPLGVSGGCLRTRRYVLGCLRRYINGQFDSRAGNYRTRNTELEKKTQEYNTLNESHEALLEELRQSTDEYAP